MMDLNQSCHTLDTYTVLCVRYVSINLEEKKNVYLNLKKRVDN